MAAPPPVLTLAVEKGPRKGDARQCTAGSALRIGRVIKGNHLAVRDVGASQQHLAIEFLPPPASRWAVSDLGSSNGSFLNGATLVPNVPTPLSHGDSIKIGESTVLAVSISSDLDLNPAAAANPGSRRSTRHATAMEEEKPPVVTRRGARKKAAAAEIPEVENEVPDAAAVVLEEEKAHPVTRRGGRGKAAAAVAEITEVENEEPDAAVVVMEEDKARPVRRRGGRGKAAVAVPAEETEEAAELGRQGAPKKAEQPSEQEKDEGEKEAPVVTRRDARKNAAELPKLEKGEEGLVARRGGRRKKAAESAELEKEEEKEEAVVVTRCGGQNNPAEPPEPEKEEQEEAPIVTRGRRKKNAATVAPPPQPPKTRSRRGQGRVKWATSAEKSVLEDEEVEEEEENEVAAPRELQGNLSTSTEVNTGEEEKGDKVSAGDVEIEAAAKTMEEEVPKGRDSDQCATSDNVGDEEKGGGEGEDDGNGELVGSGGELGHGVKVKRAGRSSLETMTLGEWFDRMEKYLPRMINEAADKMIAELEEKQKRIHEYIETLGNSSDPS